LLGGCQKKPELTLDMEPIDPPSSVAPVNSPNDTPQPAAATILIQETPPPDAVIKTGEEVEDPLADTELAPAQKATTPTQPTQPTQPRRTFSEPVQPRTTHVAAPQVQQQPSQAAQHSPIQPQTVPNRAVTLDKIVAPKAPVSPDAPKPQPVGELFKPISKPASLAMPSLPSANKPKPAAQPATESLAPMADR